MFSTPAIVPLDHDACVTPAVQRMTHGAMECPRPPAHPGARIILHHHEHNQSAAHDEWHTPAPAPKTSAQETTPDGCVVYRAIPIHDGRAPKPKPMARRRQQLALTPVAPTPEETEEDPPASPMARSASFTFDTVAVNERAARSASTSDGVIATVSGSKATGGVTGATGVDLEDAALGRARKQLFEEHVRFRRAQEPDDSDDDDVHDVSNSGAFRGFVHPPAAVPGASPAKRKGSELSTGILDFDSSFDTDEEGVDADRVSPDSVLESVAAEAAADAARTQERKSPMKSPNKFARAGAYEVPQNSPGKQRRMAELARMHRAQQRRQARLAKMSPLKKESSAGGVRACGGGMGSTERGAARAMAIDFAPIPSPGTEQIEQINEKIINASPSGADRCAQLDAPPDAPRPGRLDGAANAKCFGDVDAKPVRRTASRIARLLGSCGPDDLANAGSVDGRLCAAMRRLELPSARLEDRFDSLDADLAVFPESSFATPAPARKTTGGAAVAPMSVGT
mgnify:CR=1 FL=1